MARILVTTTTDRDRSKLRESMLKAGHEVRTASDAGGLVNELGSADWDLVLLDAGSMLDDPIDVLGALRQTSPDADVIVLAKVDQLPQAASAIRRGATLYLIEPVEPAELLAVIDASMRRRSQALVVRGVDSRSMDGFFGDTPAMTKLYRLILKVAPTDATVLITGESGTGKEVLANFIHRLSPRARGGKMVAVNCGAIPENLLESELFGHVKGSFTGAVAEKTGLLQEADRGTCFLDEIAEMPPPLQVKMLRFLQDREVRKVGGVRSEKVDVRILAATNRNLVTEIRAGRFREDLFFRLNVVQIHLPPLRERKDTIPFLGQRFIERFARQYHKRIRALSGEAQAVLFAYDYPGNIRELENILEYAVIMADGDTITLSDLPPQLLARRDAYVLPAKTYEEPPTVEAAAPAAASSVPSPITETNQPKTLAQIEQDHIRWTLARCNGNQTAAAKQLGISRTSLWRKLQGMEKEGG